MNDLDQLEDVEELDKKIDSNDTFNLSTNFNASGNNAARFQSESLTFFSNKRYESNKIGQLNQEIADFVTDDSPSATVTELRRTIHLQVITERMQIIEIFIDTIKMDESRMQAIVVRSSNVNI